MNVLRTPAFFSALLVAGYLLIYILPLNLRPLAIPDESRYAEIPREMIASGDWSTPRLIGLRYFEKPVLGYWLTAASIYIFGENNFAVRLPNAIATGLSAVLIWLLMVRTGHDRRLSLFGAAVFLTVLEVYIIGTISVLDGPFSLFLTAGMVLYYLGMCKPDKSRQQRYYFLAAGAMFGLAFLTKGFISLILPGLIFSIFIVMQKRYALFWHSYWVVLSMLLVVAPWATIIHFREPDFWRYFFWEEHIRRFLAENAQHPNPIYYFLIWLPVVMFPWFSMLPAAVSGYRHTTHNSRFTLFLVLWFIIPFVFFSVSKGKLLTYILPCLVPFSILLASGLMKYLQSGRRKWFVLGASLNAVLLGCAIVFVTYNYMSTKTLYAETESTKLIAMQVVLTLSMLVMLAAFLLSTFSKRSGVAMLVSTGMLLPVFNILLPQSVIDKKTPSFVVSHLSGKIDKNTIIVADANVFRYVAWEFKRADIFLLYPGEMTYGLSYKDAAGRLLGIEGLQAMLMQQKNGKIKNPIAVFCEEPCDPALENLFATSHKKISDNEFAVWLSKSRHSLSALPHSGG